MKVHENGFVEIKSKKDAEKALEAFHNLKAEIDDLKEESGLDELEKDAMAYKAAVQAYMVTNDLEHLQGDGYHGTLVKGAGSSRWIGDESDMTGDEPARVVPLVEILEKKFKSSIATKGSKARKVWMKITKRVVDPEAIEELVAEGTLDVDEISPAWIETTRAPYLRVFEDE
jgi:hypothetical protein